MSEIGRPSSSARPQLLLIGLGDLGGVILEFLLRDQSLNRVAVASRDPAKGLARCNLARLGAVAQGFNPEVEFHQLDLANEGATARLVCRVKPDLILLTATLQTWWLLDLLPGRSAEPLKKAGFGMWLPVHLALAHHLMRALKTCQYSGITLIAPYPDVVNCVLGRIGLAPTCGIGNIAELVARVRVLAAARLTTAPSCIEVTMAAHHALEAAVCGRSSQPWPPCYLKIEHEGREITNSLNGIELLRDPLPVSGGRLTHFLTAATALELIRGLFSLELHATHAPGPDGLPGGYPVNVGQGQIAFRDAPGLSLEQAVEINENSLPYDGIERIESDGTVVFCSDSVAAMRETLGYDCSRLRPDESDAQAGELIAKFDAYSKKRKVEGSLTAK